MQIPVTAPPSPDATSPVAVYQAFSQQATELRDQLEGLLNQRSEAVGQIGLLSDSKLVGASRFGLEERIARLDKRIVSLEEQIAQADAQVAKAAAVPGSVAPRPISRDGDEGAAFGGGMAFATALIFFWTFIRRKFWRRKRKAANSAAHALPAELAARMERLENVAESTAIEVERIGEGQRFVTKLLSEKRPAGEAIQNRSGTDRNG